MSTLRFSSSRELIVKYVLQVVCTRQVSAIHADNIVGTHLKHDNYHNFRRHVRESGEDFFERGLFIF